MEERLVDLHKWTKVVFPAQLRYRFMVHSMRKKACILFVNHYKIWLEKALTHLEFSFKKLQGIEPNIASMSEEELATWEAFVSRFARASDIFLSKVLRAEVESQDPAFRGSFRDMLHTAQKFELIQETLCWMRVRELRNCVVHEYAGDAVNQDLKDMRDLVPLLLDLRKNFT